MSDPKNTPSDVLVAISQAWGKPSTSRFSTNGIVITYDGASGAADERLRTVGAQLQVNVQIPARRNGPNTKHILAGTFGDTVSFSAQAEGIDQPTHSLRINLYQANREQGDGRIAPGIDPEELFRVADAVLGGQAQATNMLAAFVSYKLLQSEGATRFRLLADLSQAVTDSLVEAAQPS